jgi:hypothetical protein
MEKVQKPSNSECDTPSSEPFRKFFFLTVCELEISRECIFEAPSSKFYNLAITLCFMVDGRWETMCIFVRFVLPT